MIKLTTPLIDNETEETIAQNLIQIGLTKMPTITQFGPTSMFNQMMVMFAYFTGLTKFTAQTSIESLKQAYMTFLGLSKQEATYPTTTLTYTLYETLDIDAFIPEGSRVRNNIQPYIYYETTEDLTIPAGDLTGEVAAQCTISGTQGRVAANQLTYSDTPLQYVKEVTNVASTGGLEEETDEECVTRLQGVLQTYYVASSPSSFESLTEQIDSVYRAKCYPLMFPGCDGVQTPGVCTIIVYPESGRGTEVVLNAVKEWLNDKKIVGYEPVVVFPVWKEIDINCDIKFTSSISLNTMTTRITTALNDAFKDWDWATPVTISSLRTIILSVSDVISVRMNEPSEETEINLLEMPILGTLTVGQWT